MIMKEDIEEKRDTFVKLPTALGNHETEKYNHLHADHPI